MRKQDREIVNAKSRSEWERLIHEWVHDELERKMLVRHLLDGLSIAEIAEEVNLSDICVKNRLARAKRQLFSHTN